MKRKLVNSVLGLAVAMTVLVSPSSWAQQFVTGTSPSGTEVKVSIKRTPALEYPRRAMRLGVEGFVKVGFDISENGRPWNIVVEDSQPKRMFDKSATKLVKGIRFDVPEENGEVVELTGVSMTISFAL
jgi:TonB family protein